MLFRQFVDDDLGCASYLIGDPATGEAAVVDPAYAIERYLATAEEEGVRVSHVLETHTHADHLSGHGRLALDHAASVATHPLGEPTYAFDPVRDGDEVSVGALRIRVLHTPGHRPEHCCFVVDDALLTGDSLLVGGAARPDLAVDARDGAEALYDSLRRLFELPDDTRVFPGHVAGSLCGAGIGSAHSTTIGAERVVNPAVTASSREDFVARSAGVKAPRPPNMRLLVELNRGPFVAAPQPLPQLDDSRGTTILDVRPAAEFARGHAEGAINVPLDGGAFATKAGFVLRPDDRVALHADTFEQADRAAAALRAVGFLELAGYLPEVAADSSFAPVTLDELESLLADGSVDVIDVREAEERDDGYIAGSRHIPYRLLRACCEDLAAMRPIVTVCESGSRAAIAASLLAAAGLDARPVLGTGIGEWQERGGATVSFRRCGSSS